RPRRRRGAGEREAPRGPPAVGPEEQPRHRRAEPSGTPRHLLLPGGLRPARPHRLARVGLPLARRDRAARSFPGRQPFRTPVRGERRIEDAVRAHRRPLVRFEMRTPMKRLALLLLLLLPLPLLARAEDVLPQGAGADRYK